MTNISLYSCIIGENLTVEVILQYIHQIRTTTELGLWLSHSSYD